MANDATGILKDNTILALLKSLPPSQELLDFYKEKVEKQRQNEEKLLRKLADTGLIFQKLRDVESELTEKTEELSKCRQKMVDLRDALFQERKWTRKLYAENDRLKINELEYRRKFQILLQLTGRSDEEINQMVNNKEGKVEIEIPESLRGYMDSEPTKSRQTSKTKESLNLELKAVEKQLVEQEKCHMEQISRLREESRINVGEIRSITEQYELRINEISQHVNKLENEQKRLLKELWLEKNEFHKEEKKWELDREKLTRKLQFFEHFGSGSATEAEMPAYFTAHRYLERKNADKNRQHHIQRLNSELADLKNVCDSYRSQMLNMETEIQNLREQNQASKEQSQKRGQTMQNQCQILKTRYENLEQRRKQEAEGYQSDIKLLSGKLRDVQRQLIRATMAKAKEHEYIRKIRAQEEEIEQLERDRKRNPEWRN